MAPTPSSLEERRPERIIDSYQQDYLTQYNRFAMTELRVGGVIWGDTQPGYDREPAPDTSSTIPGRYFIDTGANWYFVSKQIADNLNLVTFDAPPPILLEEQQEKMREPRSAACITIVVANMAIPARAYIGTPAISGEQYDVLMALLSCNIAGSSTMIHLANLLSAPSSSIASIRTGKGFAGVVSDAVACPMCGKSMLAVYLEDHKIRFCPNKPRPDLDLDSIFGRRTAPEPLPEPVPEPVPEPLTGEERTRVPIPKAVKVAVWERDGGRCRKCGISDSDAMPRDGEHLHFDHIRPWSLNGADTVNNIQLLCGPCNREKAARFG